MSQTVLGIFKERQNAEEAIAELESLGYNPKDISIIMKDRGKAETISHDTGATVAGSAASGALTGGVIGGLAGLLVGIGAITIPGVGALLIGGPIAAALGLTGAAATTTSGAVTGALAGGVVGALVGLGLPEKEAHVYESSIKEGAILVAVPTVVKTADEVEEILSENEADKIRTVDANSEYESESKPRMRQPYHHAYTGMKGGKRRQTAEDIVDYDEE